MIGVRFSAEAMNISLRHDVYTHSGALSLLSNGKGGLLAWGGGKAAWT